MIRLGPLDFGSPWALLLLLALPLLWLARRRARPPAITFSRAALLARGPRAGRGVARALAALRTLALVGCVVALARPRSGARAEQNTSDGINILLVLDLSSSMLAEDFQPQNRLEVARGTLKRFVAGRTADRIGVVAFAAEALTQVPLTTDYPVVLAALDGLQAGQLEDGTAIGTGSRPPRTDSRTRPASRA
jgi:Ca-activated chloride channel family protein